MAEKSERYNPQEIEPKWQREWLEKGLYATRMDPDREKFYFLTMLPYPSGDLHIGHWYAMTPSDASARYRRMRGYNTFFPIGFDAFGLPAENAAIKRGVHPYQWTMSNIERMRGQLASMGAMWAWDHEAVTCDPEYYKWTQWFFLKLYDMGLAYRKFSPVDFCPKCNTTLAREQVWGEDRHCERCGTPVIKKELEQWFFKITHYADELLNFTGIDWPERIRSMQTNWIGRSEGAEVKFETEDGHEITVFTTRPDTLWGATFMVLAPEHPLVGHLTTEAYREAVEEYQFQASRQSEIERTSTEKEKTGVFIGAYAINPVNNQRIPIWIADYVLTTYGTGAIMAVPAHDERDFQFALKFGLPIIPVIARNDGLAKSYVRPGSMQPGLAARLVAEGIEFSAEPQGDRGEALFVTLRGQAQVDRYLALAKEHLLPGHWNEVVGTGWAFIFEDETLDLASAQVDQQILARCKDLDPALGERHSVMEMLWEGVPFYRDVLYHSDYGTLIHSGRFSGTPGDQAKPKVIAWLSSHGLGESAVNYRLRDWLISRQRYWGAPIPIIYCRECGIVPVPYEDLPVMLPVDAQIPPTGENALKFHESYKHVKCPKCGGDAERETDTMDTFMCSSWYQYAYVTPYYKAGQALHADDTPFDPQEGGYWLPVDQYTGGPEHATMHLLYTRFFTKAMRDMGLVPFGEPMVRLFNQGIILGPDGNRMSKSHGNVVAPDEYVERYGADAVRAYLMFIGPWDMGGPWNFQGIEGVRRFLERVWSAAIEPRAERAKPQAGEADLEGQTRALRQRMHQTIRKVTEDIEAFKYNTLIAALMEFNNYLLKVKETVVYGTPAWDEAVDSLILMLAPETPHIAEELWQRRHGGNGYAAAGSVHVQAWPAWDPELAKADTVTLIVQINGKVRDKLEVPADIDETAARDAALGSSAVQKWLAGKAVQKVIFAGGKLVNIVIK